MRRTVEYVLRSLSPPAVLALSRCWGQARRYQNRPNPLALLRSFHSARLDLLPVSFDLDGGLIVDVGANVGAWSEAVLRVHPQAEILALEPSPDARQTLERRLAKYPKATIDPRAAGTRPGRSTFYLTEASHNASLHRPLATTNELYGWGWDVARHMEVEVVDLDSLVGRRDVQLLKIDAQGAEKEVLLGAQRVLSRTAAILIEVTMVSHYEGDTIFPWLHDHLTNAGFQLSAFSQPFLSPAQRILQMDACYLSPNVHDSHSLLSYYGPGLGG